LNNAATTSCGTFVLVAPMTTNAFGHFFILLLFERLGSAFSAELFGEKWGAIIAVLDGIFIYGFSKRLEMIDFTIY
jgi:hypothetical protein